jgi:GMP synthase (glutamine-hydrolysing)
MIIYGIVATSEDYEKGDGRFQHKVRFEQLSGEPCLVMRHEHLSLDLVDQLQPKALLLSGFGRVFQEFDLSSFYPLNDLLHQTNIPTIGLCGSHQLIAALFSKDIREVDRLEDQPMRHLRPGEPDLSPTGYHPGYFKENGFYPVTLVKDDPLFEGLNNPFIVRESHYCEVKSLPTQFELLASTEACRIQTMKHRERMLYGTQFHPESYIEAYPDGKSILSNFFRIAGVI